MPRASAKGFFFPTHRTLTPLPSRLAGGHSLWPPASAAAFLAFRRQLSGEARESGGVSLEEVLFLAETLTDLTFAFCIEKGGWGWLFAG